jgi:hypothetical protein
MGTQRITLQGVKLVDILKREGEELFVFKWSLPGAYNSFLSIVA